LERHRARYFAAALCNARTTESRELSSAIGDRIIFKLLAIRDDVTAIPIRRSIAKRFQIETATLTEWQWFS
jgi:hypothetical protein